MAEHKHGSMDTSDQQRTFDGFLKMSARVAMVSIGALVFMAVFNS
ncbi:MAG: aa3-type cytochrome c oxidase subunit IV [Paracoccaceae bacterium]|nr:aa3-type cytochrome c oxidase subunit IV [Paracoccaceae bacterium]MDG1736346.1 aa3-type cytochrome c oxidase subunit IV [Paracoccaceae bacterium]MDG2258832.1 aa3-type cytochrome c oxidase subunit IV [Paracoccaceae bacterium]